MQLPYLHSCPQQLIPVFGVQLRPIAGTIQVSLFEF
jgi:hypothetical protein